MIQSSLLVVKITTHIYILSLLNKLKLFRFRLLCVVTMLCYLLTTTGNTTTGNTTVVVLSQND